MMGLMLHANAKNLMAREMYKDALEVLTMGEVSYQCPFHVLIKEFNIIYSKVPFSQSKRIWSFYYLRKDNFELLRAL